MPDDLNAQLKEAISLAQSGQRAEARSILERLVAIDPELELAWLWLATVSTDRDERIEYLERALALNPDNPTSHEAYTQLTGTLYNPPGPPAAGNQPRWLTMLTQDMTLSPTNIIILMVVVAVSIAAIIMVINRVQDNDDSSSESVEDFPTLTPMPTQPYYTPTSRFTPTPSYTPFPTPTQGPSPTSIWDAAPPTWTPDVPSPYPTRPPATATPSYTPTPEPSATQPPVVIPNASTRSAQQTQDAAPSDSPTATPSPPPSSTPQIAGTPA
jgi:hypothetical protein